MEAAVAATEMPVANEAVIADTPTTESAPPAAPSMDDDLRGIWDKHHPLKDESGKFVSRNPPEETPAEPKLADQAAETQPEQVTPAIEAPVSWSAENKAKWATLPPDVQAYIAQRDKESHDAISRAGQEIKTYEPFKHVVEQFRDTFQRTGLAPHDAFQRMMNVEAMLEQNPRYAIEQIARAYGVDLRGSEDPDANPGDPRVADLEARLAKTESYLTAQQRQQRDAEQSALAREIADFAKDKPHFESVRGIMAGLMQVGAAESMQDAYEKAIYADPTIRQAVLAKEQTDAESKRREEEAKRVKDAKKAAGVNVRSSPAIASTTRTLDDDLREIARKHYGR
jgi:hypothetical protein